MSVGKILLSYLKKHKIKAFTMLLAILFVAAISLVPAQILRILVDDGVKYNKTEKLLIYAICYGVAYVLIGIITFLKDVIMLNTSQDFSGELRKNMMKHARRLSYQTFVGSDSGSLEAYFNNDVNAINELFTSGVIDMATDLIKIIGIIIAIFIYSLVFGGIVLIVLPILIGFTLFVRRQMLRAQMKTKTLEGGVNKILLENVDNIEEIKGNKEENYVRSRYDKILKGHYKASQTSNFYDGIFSPVMQIIRNVVVIAVLLISGYDSSFFGMSVGMIISAISMLTDLFSPIEALGMEIQTIQKSLASVKRINEFFKTETDKEKNLDVINGYEIVYKNVSFSYSDKKVIENFSLDIKEGDRIAFQGVSGAGKSTLMKLAMGLISPKEGQVLIGGTEAYYLSDAAKKRLFSVVYQDPFFSGGTVYEEVSLLDKNISREQVRKALDEVGLEYITNLDLVLNEKNYSSGELALFNIARVVVRNSKIVFLDEMNARIDQITAEKIMKVLDKITEGKIVISINHYGSILKNAKIIRIGD